MPVQLSLAGVVPMGRQLIHVSERVTRGRERAVRIFRDSGIPLTGPLASLDVWDHQMAISPAPGDPSRTLWRDRLVIGGPTAAALWPVLWAIWQWRAARIRALAPTWAHDPEFAADAEDGLTRGYSASASTGATRVASRVGTTAATSVSTAWRRRCDDRPERHCRPHEGRRRGGVGVRRDRSEQRLRAGPAVDDAEHEPGRRSRRS